jgi:DNA-binding LacI/PurR family transcriptional regulator
MANMMEATMTVPAGDSESARRQNSVTLRMVAAHAGVSKSVVSRVLQGAPHVSEKRRKRVEEAIRELGYRPNSTARSLAKRRTNAIGVLVNDLSQPWFVDFLEGLNTTLHTHGLHAFIGDGRLDREADERLLRAFMEMRVDGLVLAGSMPVSDTIREAIQWLPTVVAGIRDIHQDGVDVVAEDDWLGAQLALDHLYDLGHRHIHHIAGQLGRVFELRRDSYLSWMEKHGLADRALVVTCDTTDEGGFNAGLRLLDVPVSERPTAVFVASDLACVGTLSAAWDLGLGVPDDVSLISFDNSVLARMRHTSLTSVDARARQVGERAAEFLAERIQSPSLPPREHLQVPTLSVRGTTGPAREPLEPAVQQRPGM